MSKDNLQKKMSKSAAMASIRTAGTQAEMAVRKLLYGAGYRYRLNVKKLPGSPDIVLGKYNVAIFVHGCFWHCHGCHMANLPKSNQEFWVKKITANLKRDKTSVTKLKAAGWRVLVIWECAVRGKTKLSPPMLVAKATDFIEGNRQDASVAGARASRYAIE